MIFLFIVVVTASAQSDTTRNPIQFSGHIEAYYSYDFANPDGHERPAFMYSFDRHNEVNLNLGFIKAAYAKDRVRGNMALMTGTYSNSNLAAEPGVFRNIFEANAGYQLSQKKNLWVDAGIFSSHLGFESAIGKDCWNLTRSMLADNSPYFESGVKVSYTNDNGRWFLSGLFLNGWQRIARVDGNNTPAFGHQVTFKPNGKLVFNSSSFIGSDNPDSTRMMRYFHNFYMQYQVTDKLGFIFGFDIGAQQKMKNSDAYNIWYSPVLIARVSPNQKFNIAARAEFYHDRNGVIIFTGTPNGFETLSASINIDFLLSPNIVWRIEARTFSSRDAVFIENNGVSKTNHALTTSLAIQF
jgi:hypothetical protein